MKFTIIDDPVKIEEQFKNFVNTLEDNVEQLTISWYDLMCLTKEPAEEVQPDHITE